MPPKASKRKAANGYKLPDPIAAGTVVTGLTKKKSWRIGKSIGVGGFGEIYLCSEDTTRNVGDEAALAMKIEPHENGPLFVEMNFYIRAAQPDSVLDFKRKKNLPSLGMPVHCGSGSHVYNGDKYRFLVMERFGKDLQKIFQTGKKKFPAKASFTIAIKVIDTLEYIHSQGYVHNDIKAQNLLLGHGRTKENDVYLVDFGLVSKYHRDGVHLEYKPDARKAHDGTIEYTSRDAHIGAHSRRSDLEILGYNLIHWMSGTLPWMDNLTNQSYVQMQKKGFMNEIPSFLQRCFNDGDYPSVLLDFLEYVNGLDFDTEPDYNKCRGMFKSAMKKMRIPFDGKLDFSTPKSPVKKKRKRKRSDFEEMDFMQEPPRKSTRQKPNGMPHPTPAASPTPSAHPPPGDEATDAPDGSVAKPCSAGPAALTNNMNSWSWERVLCSDPEMLIRQASRQSEPEDESPLALQHRMLEERMQKEALVNPTPAMLQILDRIAQREKEREAMTWQQQLQHLTGSKKQQQAPAAKQTWDLTPNLLTPAMEEVIQMRSKRVSVDIDIPITPDPSGSGDPESDSDMDSDFDEEYSPPSVSLKKTKNQADVVVQKFIRNYSSDSEEEGEEPATQPSNPFMLLFSPSPKRPMTDREKELDLQFDNLLASPSPNRTVGERAKVRRAAGVVTGSSWIQVSVQNSIETPDKIRNKDSPVKAAELAATCSKKVKKSLKFEDNSKSDISLSEISTVPPKISAKRKPSKVREMFVTRKEAVRKSAKRLSVIPENVCIETTRVAESSGTEADEEVTFPKKQKQKKPAAKRSLKKVKKPKANIKKAAKKDEPAARRNMRSNSSNARETRAQDWNWANVLLSHPEKVGRRKKR